MASLQSQNGSSGTAHPHAQRPEGCPGTGPTSPGSPELSPLLFHVERLHQKLGEIGQLSEHQDRLALLGTMAASVAHEINNILTPVKAYAELALSSPGERGLVIKALERAAQGVDRATRISELILACARPKATSELPASDIGEGIRRAVGTLPADPNGLHPITIEAPSGLAARIDRIALEQIVVNLLLNARRAMQTGGVTIIGATTTSSGEVEIRVTDRGCGIERGQLESIFDEFVSYPGKADVASSRGSGLGLAICRRLVSDAGGRIEIESALGRGTTVRVLLARAVRETAVRSA
jgi:two-component system, cell cycle sensor histidine kinase and response regulator CckA